MEFEATVNSVSELAKALKRKAIAENTTWFRGHELDRYELLPSLARYANGIQSEAILIKRFKQNASTFLQRPPSNEWEWLFLMQHYNVPTRLLDWTESPLVGLYFVVCNPKHDKKPGHLWCLFPTKLNKYSGWKPALAANIPCFSVDSLLDAYSPTSLASENQTALLPAAALALRDNPRIIAQHGVFTIMHRDDTPIENLQQGNDHVGRFVVPAKAKKRIRDELVALRITKLAIFPELANVAVVANEVLT
ncbi:MAG: FRG domain-containing protein [Planctomycetota bacterium]|nr:FRG domain-containing protein [Planctomycetota bacterium]